jgi:hypothetical protein
MVSRRRAYSLLPGFFLRVTPQGTRTFGIVYTTRDGRLRRCTLGPVGPVGLSEARARAKKLRGAVAQGEDPHGDQMKAKRQRLTAATVEDLVEAFLASKEALAWRPKTRQEFARILRVEVTPALGHLKPRKSNEARSAPSSTAFPIGHRSWRTASLKSRAGSTPGRSARIWSR